MASYVRNRSPSSSIPFLVNQLRQEPASNDTKAVIDFIAKYLIQLGNSAESNTDDSKNQVKTIGRDITGREGMGRGGG